MTREELLQRIWIDPQRCFGKPCIRGHRIWVFLILDLLASGSAIARDFLRDFARALTARADGKCSGALRGVPLILTLNLPLTSQISCTMPMGCGGVGI